MNGNATELARLLAGAPLVVCLGPGGVGKTTLSSVIALHQAGSGHRSLVLTIDPARRLADALGLSGLTNDPVEVASFKKMHPDGSLSALMLDPTATFDHLVAMLVSDPQRRAALTSNHFYQHLSRGLAGTLEYMAVARLHALSHTGAFDSIVLDTPPTTNALDFLEAPDRLAAFFSDKVTRWFAPAARGKVSLTARLFNRAGSTALSLLERVAGKGFVDDTVGFFGAFSDLLESFRDRGIHVGELLRNPRTVFLVVCAPDPNRIAEAEAIDRKLTESGCRAHGFIVNRVDEPFLPEEGEHERVVERATALLGGEGERERVRTFLERLETARKAHATGAERHAQVIDELRRYAGSRPVFCAPSVPSGQSARASLLALYVGLFAEAAGPAAHEAAEEARDSDRRRTSGENRG